MTSNTTDASSVDVSLKSIPAFLHMSVLPTSASTCSSTATGNFTNSDPSLKNISSQCGHVGREFVAITGMSTLELYSINNVTHRYSLINKTRFFSNINKIAAVPIAPTNNKLGIGNDGLIGIPSLTGGSTRFQDLLAITSDSGYLTLLRWTQDNGGREYLIGSSTTSSVLERLRRSSSGGGYWQTIACELIGKSGLRLTVPGYYMCVDNLNGSNSSSFTHGTSSVAGLSNQGKGGTVNGAKCIFVCAPTKEKLIYPIIVLPSFQLGNTPSTGSLGSGGSTFSVIGEALAAAVSPQPEVKLLSPLESRRNTVVFGVCSVVTCGSNNLDNVSNPIFAVLEAPMPTNVPYGSGDPHISKRIHDNDEQTHDSNCSSQVLAKISTKYLSFYEYDPSLNQIKITSMSVPSNSHYITSAPAGFITDTLSNMATSGPAGVLLCTDTEVLWLPVRMSGSSQRLAQVNPIVTPIPVRAVIENNRSTIMKGLKAVDTSHIIYPHPRTIITASCYYQQSTASPFSFFLIANEQGDIFRVVLRPQRPQVSSDPSSPVVDQVKVELAYLDTVSIVPAHMTIFTGGYLLITAALDSTNTGSKGSIPTISIDRVSFLVRENDSKDELKRNEENNDTTDIEKDTSGLNKWEEEDLSQSSSVVLNKGVAVVGHNGIDYHMSPFGSVSYMTTGGGGGDRYLYFITKGWLEGYNAQGDTYAKMRVLPFSSFGEQYSSTSPTNLVNAVISGDKSSLYNVFKNNVPSYYPLLTNASRVQQRATGKDLSLSTLTTKNLHVLNLLQTSMNNNGKNSIAPVSSFLVYVNNKGRLNYMTTCGKGNITMNLPCSNIRIEEEKIDQGDDFLEIEDSGRGMCGSASWGGGGKINESNNIVNCLHTTTYGIESTFVSQYFIKNNNMEEIILSTAFAEGRWMDTRSTHGNLNLGATGVGKDGGFQNVLAAIKNVTPDYIFTLKTPKRNILVRFQNTLLKELVSARSHGSKTRNSNGGSSVSLITSFVSTCLADIAANESTGNTIFADSSIIVSYYSSGGVTNVLSVDETIKEESPFSLLPLVSGVAGEKVGGMVPTTVANPAFIPLRRDEATLFATSLDFTSPDYLQYSIEYASHWVRRRQAEKKHHAADESSYTTTMEPVLPSVFVQVTKRAIRLYSQVMVERGVDGSNIATTGNSGQAEIINTTPFSPSSHSDALHLIQEWAPSDLTAQTGPGIVAPNTSIVSASGNTAGELVIALAKGGVVTFGVDIVAGSSSSSHRGGGIDDSEETMKPLSKMILIMKKFSFSFPPALLVAIPFTTNNTTINNINPQTASGGGGIPTQMIAVAHENRQVSIYNFYSLKKLNMISIKCGPTTHFCSLLMTILGATVGGTGGELARDGGARGIGLVQHTTNGVIETMSARSCGHGGRRSARLYLLAGCTNGTLRRIEVNTESGEMVPEQLRQYQLFSSSSTPRITDSNNNKSDDFTTVATAVEASTICKLVPGDGISFCYVQGSEMWRYYVSNNSMSAAMSNIMASHASSSSSADSLFTPINVPVSLPPQLDIARCTCAPFLLPTGLFSLLVTSRNALFQFVVATPINTIASHGNLSFAAVNSSSPYTISNTFMLQATGRRIIKHPYSPVVLVLERENWKKSYDVLLDKNNYKENCNIAMENYTCNSLLEVFLLQDAEGGVGTLNSANGSSDPATLLSSGVATDTCALKSFEFIDNSVAVAMAVGNMKGYGSEPLIVTSVVSHLDQRSTARNYGFNELKEEEDIECMINEENMATDSNHNNNFFRKDATTPADDSEIIIGEKNQNNKKKLFRVKQNSCLSTSHGECHLFVNRFHASEADASDPSYGLLSGTGNGSLRLKIDISQIHITSVPEMVSALHITGTNNVNFDDATISSSSGILLAGMGPGYGLMVMTLGKRQLLRKRTLPSFTSRIVALDSVSSLSPYNAVLNPGYNCFLSKGRLGKVNGGGTMQHTAVVSSTLILVGTADQSVQLVRYHDCGENVGGAPGGGIKGGNFSDNLHFLLKVGMDTVPRFVVSAHFVDPHTIVLSDRFGYLTLLRVEDTSTAMCTTGGAQSPLSSTLLAFSGAGVVTDVIDCNKLTVTSTTAGWCKTASQGDSGGICTVNRDVLTQRAHQKLTTLGSHYVGQVIVDVQVLDIPVPDVSLFSNTPNSIIPHQVSSPTSMKADNGDASPVATVKIVAYVTVAGTIGVLCPFLSEEDAVSCAIVENQLRTFTSQAFITNAVTGTKNINKNSLEDAGDMNEGDEGAGNGVLLRKIREETTDVVNSFLSSISSATGLGRSYNAYRNSFYMSNNIIDADLLSVIGNTIDVSIAGELSNTGASLTSNNVMNFIRLNILLSDLAPNNDKTSKLILAMLDRCGIYTDSYLNWLQRLRLLLLILCDMTTQNKHLQRILGDVPRKYLSLDSILAKMKALTLAQ